MATACPECGELKRVSVAVTSPSESRPIPIWRYHCKTCDYRWTADEKSDE